MSEDEKENMDNSTIYLAVVLANLIRFGWYFFLSGLMYLAILSFYPSFGISFITFFLIFVSASYFVDSNESLYKLLLSKKINKV